MRARDGRAIGTLANAVTMDAMLRVRCTCGAAQAELLPAGVQEVDDQEYLELGTCQLCGTTLCVREWHLSASSRWRASVPPGREPQSSGTIRVPGRND